MDARSRLQKLRDRLAESDYLRGKDVYLDGFSYLNKLEESVLEQVMRQAESVTVTLLGDRAEGTLFQNALRQRAAAGADGPAAGDGVRDRVAHRLREGAAGPSGEAPAGGGYAL